MSSILQPAPGGRVPDFLAIGHVTRDMHADGSFTLGGTVTFAALTAYQLGLAAAVVTCADGNLIAELSAHLPGIGLAVRQSEATTTFENRYSSGFRTQYLRARAEEQQVEDVPERWLGAPVVLLGPLAQELLLRQLHRGGCGVGMMTSVSGRHPGTMPSECCQDSMCSF